MTQQYTATATYGNNTTADVTSQVTWSTTLASVATISSGGLLTAGALGTATVKAQSGGGVIATTSVTVTQKQVTSISISPLTQTLSLSLGPTTVQYTATATYGDGTTANITTVATWTSLPTLGCNRFTFPYRAGHGCGCWNRYDHSLFWWNHLEHRDRDCRPVRVWNTCLPGPAIGNGLPCAYLIEQQRDIPFLIALSSCFLLGPLPASAHERLF